MPFYLTLFAGLFIINIFFAVSEVFPLKKLLTVLLVLSLTISLAACELPEADSTLGSSVDDSTQASENVTESTEISTNPSEDPTQPTEEPTQPTEEPTQPTEAPTQPAPKPTFSIAIDPQPAIVDGEHVWLSDKNLTIAYNPGDTWRTFIQENPDAGFTIDKDFYGQKDIVYYVDNGEAFEVFMRTNGFMAFGPDYLIDETNYVGLVPHRESIQTQWFYEVSKEPFMVEGEEEPFDTQGKTIILNVDTMTYTIKHIRLRHLSALSFVTKEEIIATGSYTSDDRDTLGATLTFDNGYVMKTNRSKYYRATLTIDGKSIKATSADHTDFY